jgi:hypothetical protein
MSPKKTERLVVLVEPGLMDRVRRLAWENGRSVGEVVRRMLERQLGGGGKEGQGEKAEGGIEQGAAGAGAGIGEASGVQIGDGGTDGGGAVSGERGETCGRSGELAEDEGPWGEDGAVRGVNRPQNLRKSGRGRLGPPEWEE